MRGTDTAAARRRRGRGHEGRVGTRQRRRHDLVVVVFVVVHVDVWQNPAVSAGRDAAGRGDRTLNSMRQEKDADEGRDDGENGYEYDEHLTCAEQ